MTATKSSLEPPSLRLTRVMHNLALLLFPLLVPVYALFVAGYFSNAGLMREVSIIISGVLPALIYYAGILPYRGGRFQLPWIWLAVCEAALVYIIVPEAIEFKWRIILMISGMALLMVFRAITPVRPRATVLLLVVWWLLDRMGVMELAPGLIRGSVMDLTPGARLDAIWLVVLGQAALFSLLRGRDFWLPLGTIMLAGLLFWHWQILAQSAWALLLLFFIWTACLDMRRTLVSRLLEMSLGVLAVFLCLVNRDQIALDVQALQNLIIIALVLVEGLVLLWVSLETYLRKN